jgi:acylphosphatase
MEWYRYIVSGRVQGVFYRKSVSQALMKKQFKGYIRNLNDGTVEVVAEVYDEDLDVFEKILEDGSPLSNVDKISKETIDDVSFNTDGFEIRE